MIPPLAHDRSAVAWFIVAAYLAGAALAFWSSRSADGKRERLFWAGCGLLLVVLGLNKQLDFQGALTDFGRALARQDGWYGHRRQAQAAFVLALGTGAGLVMIALSFWLRRSASTVKLAAVGLVLLFAFVLLRAASFHHMDGWVTRNVAGIRSGWWLELAGIAAIGLSAVIFLRATVRARADCANGRRDGAQG